MVVGACNVPCYFPQKAWRTPSTGSVVFVGEGKLSNLVLPCGQCIGCRLERSRQWAVRIMHEASLHSYNSFLTLTYRDENLPVNGSLVKRDHQLFMKRLRYSHNVRYYTAAEYGGLNKRPHFHVCLFGYHFPDRYMSSLKTFSPELETSWRLGNCDVRDLTFELAAYAARYICEKRFGDHEKVYERIDEYGEIINVEKEFALMSRGRGIGRGFFDAYKDGMYPSDRVIVRGKPAKPPRYYDKLFEKVDAAKFEEVKVQRELDAALRYLDNTPDRLAVRHEVARLNLVRKTKV